MVKRLSGPRTHVCWTPDRIPVGERILVSLVQESDLAEIESEVERLKKENYNYRRMISATHKNAVEHVKCERTNCPICEGGLFICADCGAAEIETEERICSAAEYLSKVQLTDEGGDTDGQR